MNPPINGGSVPLLGGSEAAKKQAIAQQMAAITTGVYIRAASRLIVADDGLLLDTPPERFETIAQKAASAAQCYFTGLGIADFRPVNPDGTPAE